MPVWNRDQVASRITAGEILLIYRNQLLRIPTSWLNTHPGGALPILHLVGRDATDEIEAFHSPQILKWFTRYTIGSVQTGEYGWESLVPPVTFGWVRKIGKEGNPQWFNEATEIEDRSLSNNSQILLVKKDSLRQSPSTPSLEHLHPPPSEISFKVQAQHSTAYKTLHKRIVDAGLYKTPYLTGYGPEIARYCLLGGLSALAYSKNWLMTSAFLLGLMWHQLAFTAHDLGHMGVTHNWTIDRILGTIIADFMGGLSISWWVDVRVCLRF